MGTYHSKGLFLQRRCFWQPLSVQQFCRYQFVIFYLSLLTPLDAIIHEFLSGDENGSKLPQKPYSLGKLPRKAQEKVKILFYAVGDLLI